MIESIVILICTIAVVPTLGETNSILRKIVREFRAKKKKQGTRLLKCARPECGYTVRTTEKWLDVGMPVCPDGSEMVCEAIDDDEGEE